jgi:DNA modification methylase
MALNMARLNNLTGKEWIKFTKSWFVVKAKTRSKKEIQHPAKYPEELVDEFVKFFTYEGDVVFDPFVGVGSTVVSALRLGRSGVGIELNPDFYDVCKSRCESEMNLLNKSCRFNVINGDTRTCINDIPNDSVDFIMTSPPYWDILAKKRGNSDSQHNQRAQKGLQLTYSEAKEDLGNIDDYDQFLKELVKIFNKCNSKLRDKKYMCVVVQNFRNTDGEYMTFAWDLVKLLSKKWIFCGEKIWIQEDKKLGIWGFPSIFVPNIHHHYCLIFKKK